jgi:hypothetical protein
MGSLRPILHSSKAQSPTTQELCPIERRIYYLALFVFGSSGGGVIQCDELHAKPQGAHGRGPWTNAHVIPIYALPRNNFKILNFGTPGVAPEIFF